MNGNDIQLAAGLRTPFARVDGPLAGLGAVELSVPVMRAMAGLEPMPATPLPRARGGMREGIRPDLLVWGTVIPNLGYSNIAREVQIDAGLDRTVPAFSTVLACSTSMVAALEESLRPAAALFPGALDRPAPCVVQGPQGARYPPAYSRGQKSRDGQEHGRALRGDGESLEHCARSAGQARARKPREGARGTEGRILRRPDRPGGGDVARRLPPRRHEPRASGEAAAGVRPGERQGHADRGQLLAPHRR